MPRVTAEVLAYFLTFRTYGTWLPGDVRGWVDRRRAAPGAPYEEPSARLEDDGSQHMRAAPLVLTPAMRVAVASAVTEVCTYREWKLYASNIRTNHAHLVLWTPNEPERAMNDLKVWSTRRLRDEGLIAPNRPVWARHGSTKTLTREESVAAACWYVVEGQDTRGDG